MKLKHVCRPLVAGSSTGHKSCLSMLSESWAGVGVNHIIKAVPVISHQEKWPQDERQESFPWLSFVEQSKTRGRQRISEQLRSLWNGAIIRGKKRLLYKGINSLTHAAGLCLQQVMLLYLLQFLGNYFWAWKSIWLTKIRHNLRPAFPVRPKAEKKHAFCTLHIL